MAQSAESGLVAVDDAGSAPILRKILKTGTRGPGLKKMIMWMDDDDENRVWVWSPIRQ